MNIEVKKERLQSRLGPEIKEFRESRRTLQLATICAQGKPNVSYTPFVLVDGSYYILISKIARHARNLLENPQVSFMMIEDEENLKMVHARKRLTYEAQAIAIDRESAQWQIGIDAMQGRFGEIIDNLSNMADFILFHLQPENGLFVKGFGKAFQVGSDDQIDFVHLDQGHQAIDKDKLN
ncbi:heme utilization protein HutZ [Psychromonas sp. Urea-02u-13]|uniref:heme utilization protein HutZ n=1 Tax=Psychromonas sp. Urea-02u-13 TaxID=2058326 RepID=UPI000C32C6A8|nr:heme utilization protein HutZ [Psychromonas sp. Urea-02u-13]PKG39237.1 heme utilization protein HutZ [Psychromonas sp. Urea-02u-13]